MHAQAQTIEDASDRVRTEADNLISELCLMEILSEHGDTELGGSHSYDLMIARDLDFQVVVGDLNHRHHDIQSELLRQFIELPAWRIRSVNFYEKERPGSKTGSIWVGLDTTAYKNINWHLDIWVTPRESMPPQKIELGALQHSLRHCSKAQRHAILCLKSRAKGDDTIRSVEIYIAVMRHGISTYSDFNRWRKTYNTDSALAA